MTDKIVTHEDLDALRNIRTVVCRPNNHPTGCTCPGSALLDRLIVAAEADAPPLPVRVPLLYTGTDGDECVGYVQPDGTLTRWRNGAQRWHGRSDDYRDRLTPLRPTVTEADVERAAVEASFSPSIVRRIAYVLGIEVTP